MYRMNSLGAAAIASLAIFGSVAAGMTAADARPLGGGFRGGSGFHGGGYNRGGGFYRGNRGFGIGAGIATGLAIGGLGYGYGYPSYAYSGYGYGDCYLQRRLVVDQFGRRFWQPVRICS
jgi:hypothetical protein